jgi:hypothetical protein
MTLFSEPPMISRHAGFHASHTEVAAGWPLIRRQITLAASWPTPSPITDASYYATLFSPAFSFQPPILMFSIRRCQITLYCEITATLIISLIFMPPAQFAAAARQLAFAASRPPFAYFARHAAASCRFRP